MQNKIEVVTVGTSFCTRCFQQKQMLENICPVTKYYYDTAKEKEAAQKQFDINPNDEDAVPVFILFINDKEVYRNFVPISPPRIKLELEKINWLR